MTVQMDRFIYLAEPTDEEIAALVRSLHHKVIRRPMGIGVTSATTLATTSSSP